MSSLLSGWSIKPLGEVATLQRGFDLPLHLRTTGDVPVFAANGIVGTHNVQKVKGPGVVTGRSGTLGEVHFVKSDYWPLNTALWVKDFHGNDPKWVARLLKWMRLETHTRGTGVPTLNRNLVHVVPVLVPPLEEQQRIAAILDKADAIRRKRSHAIQLTEELLRATFLELVGSKHPAYKEWVEVSLADLALPRKNSMRTGPFGSTLLHSEFVDEGVAVLGIDNAVQNRFAWGERRFITLEKYQELKRYTVNPEDVIITIMGTTGRSAVVPEEIPTAIVTKHLATITLDSSKALPEYLSNAIHREPEILGQIAAQNRGAIMAGLNLGIIKQLKLRLPPLEQQLLYDKVVKKIRHQQEKFEKAAKTADILFNTLLHRAFTGEL